MQTCQRSGQTLQWWGYKNGKGVSLFASFVFCCLLFNLGWVSKREQQVIQLRFDALKQRKRHAQKDVMEMQSTSRQKYSGCSSKWHQYFFFKVTILPPAEQQSILPDVCSSYEIIPPLLLPPPLLSSPKKRNPPPPPPYKYAHYQYSGHCALPFSLTGGSPLWRGTNDHILVGLLGFIVCCCNRVRACLWQKIGRDASAAW